MVALKEYAGESIPDKLSGNTYDSVSILNWGPTSGSSITLLNASDNFNANDIDRWHKQKGWKGIGYHYVILLDGTVEQGRELEAVGAHCSGHNAHSVGICYIGGISKDGKPKDTRTPQ